MRLFGSALLRNATLTATAAGAVLGLVAAPAIACPEPHEVEGPTFTYDAAYATAKTRVAVIGNAGRTTVRLAVSGLPASAAGKTLGAHVHTRACGPDAADAGPHYQAPGAAPGTPLHDREIWLALDVGEDGGADAEAQVPWTVAEGAAGSVVVHAGPTDHRTGDAGARLLCTTVPFGGH
ncbi:superoxide dismutase family protein [Spirillospora sp. NPDC047279]|uniref:superoxide dismutase family protein n=1 Tax=Spirillospora sp. NPDC047279 TaxID=3155478 RepID=UPI003407BBA2